MSIQVCPWGNIEQDGVVECELLHLKMTQPLQYNMDWNRCLISLGLRIFTTQWFWSLEGFYLYSTVVGFSNIDFCSCPWLYTGRPWFHKFQMENMVLEFIFCCHEEFLMSQSNETAHFPEIYHVYWYQEKQEGLKTFFLFACLPVSKFYLVQQVLEGPENLQLSGESRGVGQHCPSEALPYYLAILCLQILTFKDSQQDSFSHSTDAIFLTVDGSQ